MNSQDQNGTDTATGGRGWASLGARSLAAGGGAFLLLVLLGYFLGTKYADYFTDGDGPDIPRSKLEGEHDRAAKFVSVVLADTEAVWTGIFQNEIGEEYELPTLVLFRGETVSPCGGTGVTTGPFYCAANAHVYLDTSFFAALHQKLRMKGDFASSYVVAHEVAHHVQNMFGILGEAKAISARVNKTQADLMTLRVELQAECYAGVWARHARERIGAVEYQDFRNAMKAIQQVIDDARRNARGARPVFLMTTEGTDNQRELWFERGYQSASIRMCDTFRAEDL